MDFIKKLENIQDRNKSLLCIGLDTNVQKIPQNITEFQFNKKIIETSYTFVCAYKLQFASYSANGIAGLSSLKKTIVYLKDNHPSIPVIYDAKRSDVPTSSEMYAEEAFDWLDVDAVTVIPYLGFDSIEPFLKRKQKGVIVICRSSNKSAGEFQDLKTEGEELYLKIARRVFEWSKNYPNLLMVVGATWPEQLKKVRQIAKGMIFLVPGIGSQGGDLKAIIQSGLRKDKKGLIISSSSSIIFAQNPRSAALKLRDEINKYR